MSKAASVFSLLATPQKNQRRALVTFLAMTSLVAQVSYAVDEHGCTDKQYWSSFMGRCETTQVVTVTGQRDNSLANQKLPNDPSVAALPIVNGMGAGTENAIQNALNNPDPNANGPHFPSALDSNKSPWGTNPKSIGPTAVNNNSQGSGTAGGDTAGGGGSTAGEQTALHDTDVSKLPKDQQEYINSWQKDSKGEHAGTNGSKGQCSASEQLDPTKKYECDSTYNLIDNAKLASQITQAAGGSAVTASGTVANIKAQNAGTQSAVAEAAASTSEKAGMLQTALGIASAAIGAYEIKRSVDHKNYGHEISGLKDQEAARAATGATSGTKAEVYNTAMGEQAKIEKTAMQAGAMAVYQGAVQASAGVMAIAAAKQAKELAGKLSNATGTSYQITSANPTALTNTGTTSTAINPGTQTDPAVATNDGTIKANDVPNISPPVNPDGTPSGPGGGPTAGGFTPGNPQAAGGGGGSPNIGVGSMQAAKGDPEPTGPKMADTKGNSSYAQGSGAGFGGAGGGVSAEKSADLGFLANLLPKPQEEMGKNGILDYGSRSPASMAPYSFLGKDVNIFQRISDRTTAKFKSGDVGGS